MWFCSCRVRRWRIRLWNVWRRFWRHQSIRKRASWRHATLASHWRSLRAERAARFPSLYRKYASSYRIRVSTSVTQPVFWGVLCLFHNNSIKYMWSSYRPHTEYGGKVMFLHVSVILSTEGGGSASSQNALLVTWPGRGWVSGQRVSGGLVRRRAGWVPGLEGWGSLV